MAVSSLPEPERARTSRRNLRVSMGDGASYGAMIGLGETYFPAFALAVGMSEATAGLVASVPVVSGGIMQLVSLRGIRLVGSEQRWVVMCATVQAMSFVPLVAAAVHGAISLPLLLMLASLYWAAGLSTGPAWNTWMESIVPAGIRARHMGQRSRIQQLTTLLALLASGVLLHSAESDGRVLAAFAILFGCAATARVTSVLCLAAHRSDQRLTRRLTHARNHSKFQAMTRSGRRLLVFLVVVQACVQLSGPFFTPFMLKQLGLSYFQFVYLMAVAFLARIVAIASWTTVASRCGAATLLWIGAVGLVPLSALWIVSDALIYLTAIQAASGIAWAAYELGFFLLFFETLPPHRRTKMLTYYNFANTLAMFVGAALGAALLNYLGSGLQAYYVLFALSGIGRFLALGLLWRTELKPVPIHALAVRILGVRATTASLDVPVLAGMNGDQDTRA